MTEALHDVATLEEVDRDGAVREAAEAVPHRGPPVAAPADPVEGHAPGARSASTARTSRPCSAPTSATAASGSTTAWSRAWRGASRSAPRSTSRA